MSLFNKSFQKLLQCLTILDFVFMILMIRATKFRIFGAWIAPHRRGPFEKLFALDFKHYFMYGFVEDSVDCFEASKPFFLSPSLSSFLFFFPEPSSFISFSLSLLGLDLFTARSSTSTLGNSLSWPINYRRFSGVSW